MTSTYASSGLSVVSAVRHGQEGRTGRALWDITAFNLYLGDEAYAEMSRYGGRFYGRWLSRALGAINLGLLYWDSFNFFVWDSVVVPSLSRVNNRRNVFAAVFCDNAKQNGMRHRLCDE